MENYKQTISSHGYILLRMPNHPNVSKNGYVYEHRFIMENKIGRFLDKKEIVHHKDGNKQNNSIDNLELVSNIAEHKVKHRKIGNKNRKPNEKNLLIICNCGCGKMLKKYDNSGRPRVCLCGHNKRVKIKQLDMKGNVIALHIGVREASRNTGINERSISGCIRKEKNRKTAGGYKWEIL